MTPPVVHWIFRDPVAGDSYTFQINPNAASSLYGPAQINDMGQALNGKQRLWGRPALPVDWQFSGIVRTQAQYDAFVDWMSRDNRITIQDHVGRTLSVQIKTFAPTADRARRNVPWRHDYTIKALVFSVISGPIGDFLLDGFETARSGAALDTTTSYQGANCALITLQVTTTVLGFQTRFHYATAAPVTRTYPTPFDLTNERMVTMRMQWWPDATPAPSIRADSLTCALTLTSAAGDITVNASESFPSGDDSWHRLEFILPRNALSGQIPNFDQSAVTGYSFTLHSPYQSSAPRGVTVRVDNQRAKPIRL